MRLPLTLVGMVVFVGCTGRINDPPSASGDPAPETEAPPVAPPPTTDPLTPPPPTAAVCTPVPARVTTLSSRQYAQTVLSLDPTLVDRVEEMASAVTDGPRGAQLSEPTLEALLQTSEPLAEALADRVCIDGDADCVATWVRESGRQLFRRPLTDADVARFRAFYDDRAAEYDARSARAMVIQALLLSPEVLFRTEIGEVQPDGTTALTPYERAQALSYLIADGPPDDALWAAARQGDLQTTEGMRASAERLLATADSSKGLLRFVDDLFHYRSASQLPKDPATYPRWSEALGADFAAESERFVHHVLWDSSGTMAELLTAPYTFATARTAAVYGIDSPTTDFERADMPLTRRGLLMQGAFLATYAHDDSSAPIARGHFVREQLLCQAVPPPPTEVLNEFVERDPMWTARQWLNQAHAAQPACVGCHRLMDPIGLTFELFDGIGAYRTEDVGQPIDASGMISSFRAIENDIPVDGPVALVGAVATMPQFRTCMTERMFSYVAQRDVEESDLCVIEAAAASFQKDDDLRQLLVQIVAHPALFHAGSAVRRLAMMHRYNRRYFMRNLGIGSVFLGSLAEQLAHRAWGATAPRKSSALH